MSKRLDEILSEVKAKTGALKAVSQWDKHRLLHHVTFSYPGYDIEMDFTLRYLEDVTPDNAAVDFALAYIKHQRSVLGKRA